MPVLALATLAGAAQAFFPTNGKTLGGALGTSHMEITRQAVKDLDNEFFGISKLTKPMTKAMEEIAQANADVDLDQKNAPKHFDGESLPEGQARLLTLLQGVKDALGSSDAASARAQLGQALHTLQDFYSHSNWIEAGNSSPNPALGRPGASLTRLPANVATCQNCTTCVICLTGCLANNVDCSANLVTTQITSGYYSGENAPFNLKPGGKCSHGGPFDFSTFGLTGGINKDSTSCVFSPHDQFHGIAVSVAREATKQFIRDIKGAVTMKQLKLLLGVGPTLTIAMDTTGSMGSIIDGVKQQAIQIVNARLGTDEEPSKYVLAPFNDPSVPSPTVTTDPDVFKAAISSLFASGGGDCPELAMTGMLGGLSASDEGGDLFMFTDASAKDESLAGNVDSLALSKDIKVFPILFGSCSPIDPGFIRIANDSGGQLFFLGRFEAGAVISNLADAIVRANAVTLLSVGDTLTGAAKSYTVPVDSTVSRVTFSVSGPTNVTVTRPDGTVVQAADPGVTLVHLSSGAIFTVTAPAVGAWGVSAAGSGSFSLLVTAESGLDLTFFQFVAAAGRPGHEGFFPIDGLPVAGDNGTADALLDGPFGTAGFELRTKAGAPLQGLSLPLVPETTNEFLGPLTLPATPFVVYATGNDAAGNPYQRALSSTIAPQTVSVLAPPAQDLPPGHATTYTFQVKNLGAADTFRVSAADDRHFVSGVSAASIAIASGTTAPVDVTLTVPTAAVTGTLDTLTVSVQAVSSDAHNFAVVRSNVGSSNQPPDCSAATASEARLWPADHTLRPVSIEGVTDPDGDPVTISIDAVSQDEPANFTGDGDTCPDASGIGTALAQLRAERDGNGNGRVYTVSFTASDGRGGTCSSTVKVCVPHDNAHSCVEDGALFDSLVCQ